MCALYLRSGGAWHAVAANNLYVQDHAGVSGPFTKVKQLYVMCFNTTTLVHEWKLVQNFAPPAGPPTGAIHQDSTDTLVGGVEKWRCYYSVPTPTDPLVTSCSVTFYRSSTSSTGPWEPLATIEGGLNTNIYSDYSYDAFDWTYTDAFYNNGAGSGPTQTTSVIRLKETPPFP